MVSLHIKIQDLCKESETLDLYRVLKKVVEIWKSELLIHVSVAMYCSNKSRIQGGVTGPISIFVNLRLSLVSN